jgi:hypothetical protein
MKKIIAIVTLCLLAQAELSAGGAFRKVASKLGHKMFVFGKDQGKTAVRAFTSQIQESPIEAAIGGSMGGAAAFILSNSDKGTVNTFKNVGIGSVLGAAAILNRRSVSRTMQTAIYIIDEKKRKNVLAGGAVGAFVGLRVTDKDTGIIGTATNMSIGAAIGATIGFNGQSLKLMVSDGFKEVNEKLNSIKQDLYQLKKMVKEGLHGQEALKSDLAAMKKEMKEGFKDASAHINKISEELNNVSGSQSKIADDVSRSKEILEKLSKKFLP